MKEPMQEPNVTYCGAVSQDMPMWWYAVVAFVIGISIGAMLRRKDSYDPS